MPVIQKSVASLRIMGDHPDPEEITLLLGHAPTLARRKGSVYRSKAGKERVAVSGIWSLEAIERKPGDPDAQVTEILASLTSNLEVWRGITERFRSDLFFGLFMGHTNEGFSLFPATLVALGSRGIAAGFDIYGPVIDEPNSPKPTQG